MSNSVSKPTKASYALPPHPIGEEGKAYIASMTPKQLELHKLAMELLGSSYFVEKTNGFLKWSQAQKKN